jgi:hypothetical protein
MTLKLRTLLVASTLSALLFGTVSGCNQADNPKPVEAPLPPPPKPEELQPPTKQGKAFDPGQSPRYKKMMESMAKQSRGGS